MRVVAIKRIDRSDRADWVPLETPKGFQLVDRTLPYPARNLVANATFAVTLDQAGTLIEKGFAIRMAKPGANRGNYIYPKGLQIDRV